MHRYCRARTRCSVSNHRRGLTATGLLLAGLLLPLSAGAQLLMPPPGAVPMAPAAGDQGMAFSQSNIPAEATAADAVQAKERALAAGRRAAWQALGTSAGFTAPRLSDAQIDDLVTSIIVEQERVTPTRYTGRITVNFAPDRVRAVLAGRIQAGGNAAAPLAGGSVPATPASNFVEATASFRSLGEWLELRRRLLSAAPVASVEVQSLAVDAARVKLGLRANPAEAAAILAAAGVALQPGSGMVPGDAWRLGLGRGG